MQKGLEMNENDCSILIGKWPLGCYKLLLFYLRYSFYKKMKVYKYLYDLY